MRSLMDRWATALVHAVVLAAVAFSLSTALPACSSSTAPRFPPPDQEFEDEEPGDDEDED